jgi:taurine dioxygenase
MTKARDSSNQGATVAVEPCSVHIGADIGGVDLSQPLSEQQVREIRNAVLRWKVVFFHDQVLDHAAHVRFASLFGDPTPGHVVFGGESEFPAVYSIAKNRTANSNREQALLRPWSGWHTDITAAINPPWASVLRGVTVPPYGGDTQWTNLVTAFAALSPVLQSFVSTLRGVHRFTAPGGGGADDKERVQQRALVSEHPLVRVHPETGEKALYVSPAFLKHIVGVTPAESQKLLELLWEHAVRPEFTVRFRWRPGCLAFWDNRATAHLAPSDIFDTEFDRQFYRVTLNGDIPVDPRGMRSTAIEGDPIDALAVSR